MQALRSARRRAALHAPGRGDRRTRSPGATSSSSRRPRRARRSATTRRCSTRSCRIRRARALYLFPTKALAQDQLAELQATVRDDRRGGAASRSACSPTTATRRRTRGATIRARAHLVLSNPDMVHSGILPHHPRWAKLFENLRYVVIDELHAYRGVFGSHLCNVLRRLRRICRHYGSNPVFICSSATIANPRELAERLTEQPFELVDESGAPRGEKFFVFVNPPVVNQQLGIRRSYLGETRRVAVGVPQAQPAADRLRAEPARHRDPDDLSEGRFRGRAGRAGADPRLSRRLPAAAPARDREGAARRRSVRAVVSTNALELGIDIGALDVCGDGRLSGHDRRDVAARRPRRPPRRPIGGGDGGAAARRSISSSSGIPSYFFDASPEHALDRSGQPAHPASIT